MIKMCHVHYSTKHGNGSITGIYRMHDGEAVEGRSQAVILTITPSKNTSNRNKKIGIVSSRHATFNELSYDVGNVIKKYENCKKNMLSATISSNFILKSGIDNSVKHLCLSVEEMIGSSFEGNIDIQSISPMFFFFIKELVVIEFTKKDTKAQKDTFLNTYDNSIAGAW